ncbi:MAG: hypothetical protein IT243_09155 [Bacteroidia bacterium]|nr:hypothetical protein [Bacteroidia bacterium]
MNRKLLYCIVLLLFISNFSLAQKSKLYKSGKKTVSVPYADINDAFSINSNDFLAVSYHVKGLFRTNASVHSKAISKFNIYKFDDQFELIQKTSLQRDIYGKRVYFEKLLKFGDNTWLFFSYSNIDSKKNYLFIQKFDQHNLEIEGDPIKVAEMPYIRDRLNYGYYDFLISKDGKYLMIFGIYKYANSKNFFSKFKKQDEENKIQSTVWVLNDKIEIVNYVKKLNLKSISSNKLSVLDYAIGNDGSILLLGSEKLKEEKKKKFKIKKSIEDKIEAKKFVIVKVDTAGETKEYDFINKKISIIDMKMALNPVSGNIYAICLYSERLKGAKGVLNIELSYDDLSEINFDKLYFSDNLIKEANTRKTIFKKRKKTKEKEETEETEEKPKNKYLSKKDEVREDTLKNNEDIHSSNQEISNLSKVVHISFDKSGNPIVIFEKQWLEIVVESRTDSKGATTTTTTYHYYYDNVILCKIENSKISSNKVILKQGVIVNFKKSMGFDCIENDEKIILLYGDKTAEFDKVDLNTNLKNGRSYKETKYKILSYYKTKILAPNKMLVFKFKSKHRLELELIQIK